MEGLEERYQQMLHMRKIAQGIAHDFNNLNAVTLLHLDILGEKVQAVGPQTLIPGLDRDLESIRESLLKASQFTSQLLAFSRTRSARIVSADINTLLRAAHADLVKESPEQAARWKLTLAEGLPTCKVDSTQTQQLIRTLLMNALESMPTGGDVLTQTQLTERGSPTAKFVIMIFQDAGKGMTPETLSRLFTPFFTTKSKGKGIGLNLATAYCAVRGFGGDIEVESTPGVGSIFRVFLPIG